MRLKTFYTDTEITTELYTFGKEWQLESGDEYIGQYHTYTTGEVYTESEWVSTSKKLVKYEPIPAVIQLYQKLKPRIKLKFTSPVVVKPEPNTTDVETGYFFRYFIKKQNELNIIEIDRTQYEMWQSEKIDPVMYIAVSVKWYITGPSDDIDMKTYRLDGVGTKNLKELKSAELIIPGMLSRIQNLKEYYFDNDYIIPRDINE
jgi:hypothetical protein